MNTNRFSRISFGLLILVVALVSASFVSMNNSSKKAASNTYLPLPPGKQTQLYNAARDARILYHRPSSVRVASSAAVYSDYFERHAELSSLAALSLGASDYADRHPELSATATSPDLTDYYFRHINDR